MSSKINIGRIVDKHIQSIFDTNQEKLSFWDIATFVVFPVVFSLVLIRYHVIITNDYANTIISGLSIYIGLSLNFIGIIFELSTKEKFRKTNVLDVLKETIANIIVTAIISLIIILLILARNIELISFLTYLLAYFFLFELLVTLLMVFKRVYTILIESIDKLN